MSLKMERGRTLARCQALQLLFQADALDVSVEAVLEGDYLISKGPLDDYARLLATGTAAHLDAIDTALHVVAENWSVGRMPAVDRSLLRMAVYEMRLLPGERPDVAVVIDEAVEIAKSYGTDESPRFVNGVLGRIAREEELPDFLHRACTVSADDAEAACIARLWLELDPDRVADDGAEGLSEPVPGAGRDGWSGADAWDPVPGYAMAGAGGPGSWE